MASSGQPRDRKFEHDFASALEGGCSSNDCLTASEARRALRVHHNITNFYSSKFTLDPRQKPLPTDALKMSKLSTLSTLRFNLEIQANVFTCQNNYQGQSHHV